MSAFIAMVSAFFTPVHAQNTLTVAPDGSFTTIESAIAAANTGDVIEIHSGVYPAPLIIEKSVSLIGIDSPVIDGQGKGSLVVINASNVVFSGFTLRHSGQSLAHEDTGIVVQAAHVTVSNNLLDDVMFGIYFANASNGLAENNTIHGKPLDESMRGDGIRVWYSNDVQLISNDVINGRDTLIWYSNNITIRNNHIHSDRYGLHFMYNNNAIVEDNIIENNAVGAYMMYSAGLTMTGNRFSNNRGASGYAIALKDMDHARIEHNQFIGNVVAVYLDNSPSLYDSYNIFSHNFVAYNNIGLVGLPSVKQNIFQDNTFLENYQQISVQGRGNLLGNLWSKDGIGNYWSNYIGYDRNGDGVGDMPYREEKLFESLADNEPILRLFNFSPASQVIDFAASAFPSLRPDPKVIDEAPKMHYVMPAGLEESAQAVSVPFLAATLILSVIGGAICALALRGNHRRAVSRKSLEPVQTAT